MRITEKEYLKSLQVVKDYVDQTIKEAASANSILDIEVEHIEDFTVKALNAMRRAGVVKVSDLVTLYKHDLMGWGTGRKTIDQIQSVLNKHGLSLKEIPNES